MPVTRFVAVPVAALRQGCCRRNTSRCRMQINQEMEAQRLLREMKLLGRPGFPIFETFVNHWVPERFLHVLLALDGGHQGPISSASIQLFYAVFVFLKSGSPVFKIRPDLITSLRDTEIPALPVELLRTPFEGVQVQVPKGTFAEPATLIQNIFISHVPGDRFRVVYIRGEYTNYTNLVTDGRGTIKDAMTDTTKKSEAEMPAKLLQAIKEEAMYANYYASDVFRFAVNCMLYVTCPEADMHQDKTKQQEIHAKLQGLKGGRKRDVLLRKLAQEKNRKIYIVGANIRLSKEYTADLTKSGKSWVLKHRCRVRGHWRQQPYGPKGSLRKPRWIRPYFKGPLYAEMLEKGYIVQ